MNPVRIVPLLLNEPSDYDTFDHADDYCGNCGGEGFVYHCIDGCCEDAEEGCDLCARRCDWCNPPPKRTMPTSEVNALRQILADALEKAKQA